VGVTGVPTTECGRCSAALFTTAIRNPAVVQVVLAETVPPTDVGLAEVGVGQEHLPPLPGEGERGRDDSARNAGVSWVARRRHSKAIRD